MTHARPGDPSSAARWKKPLQESQRATNYGGDNATACADLICSAEVVAAFRLDLLTYEV
jgi:hypothetical protein